MAVLDGIIMKSKFRGCMLGSLIGDCLGAPFEGEPGDRTTVQSYFDQIDAPNTKKPLRKQYTDDTAMTKSVAQCLIDKPPVDYKYLAKLFVKEYFTEPRRGYGGNVVEIFRKLRLDKYQDIYRPSREQFGGTGSFGNGGAMRIAPVSLFFLNNYEGLIEAARKTTELTHTHSLGVNGALLQAIAVQQGLLLNPNEKTDYKQFTDTLIEKMKPLEESDIQDLEDPIPYQTQLKVIQKLFSIEKPDHPLSDDEVVACLGVDISALHSVPTAIYCYLRAQKDIPGIQAENVFRRTIQYAISLGGDSDTIASMAGSIAGAHLGEEQISSNIRNHCEFVDDMIKIADSLLQVTPGIEVTNGRESCAVKH